MAIMTLTRAVTQQDLDPLHLEVESFMEEFSKHRIGPFSAKVNLRGDIIYLGGVADGWQIPNDPGLGWFKLDQDGGHPVA